MKQLDQRWEWPGVVYALVFATSAPLVAIEWIDSAAAMAVKLVHTPSHRGFVFSAIDFSLLPTFALIAWLLTRRGIPGIYLSALSILLSLTWWLNFRGPFVRVGTFDYFEYSYLGWFKFPVAGLATGIVAGLLFRRSRQDFVSPNSWFWGWPGLLLGSSFLSFWVGRHCNLTSNFPPTRWMALIAMAVITSVLLAVGQISWRTYEKGVYTR